MKKQLSSSRRGRYVPISCGIGETQAFIPPFLPPDPPVDLASLQQVLEEANQALGRLDGMAVQLPDPLLFNYMYVRREALLSSEIEGTQSSLSELLVYESAGAPRSALDDVREVSNYVDALDHGLARVKEGHPLSLQLMKEMHEKLLSSGRGSKKEPGEFRSTQNWIGVPRSDETVYVPPPPEKVEALMCDLEKFLRADTPGIPRLLKAGMVHLQFESIHPFLDGNGRLGRLLIPLLFCGWEILSQPLLYLSLYFKKHRQRYYELLQQAREEGDWESWLEFFLRGVTEVSRQAAATARRLLETFEKDQRRIEKLGRAGACALQLHKLMRKKIFQSVAEAVTEISYSGVAIRSAMGRLEEMGILRELTGRRYGRRFGYLEYLRILEDDREFPDA